LIIFDEIDRIVGLELSADDRRRGIAPCFLYRQSFGGRGDSIVRVEASESARLAHDTI
jgi:hypothetical protein